MKRYGLPIRILLWTAANSASGAAIGLAIAAFREGDLDPRILWVSVLFGNVVGFTAILSAVYFFPRYLLLPTPVRLILQVATLLGVSILGTGIVILIYPLFFLHEFRTAIRILIVNGVVATIVGTLLFSYETMRERLAESLRVLEDVRLKEADLRAQAARAELTALQARINPHFFFNTLNTISSLVAEDPDGAEEIVSLLADLFRYTLRTSGTALVPFADEVAFVETYLSIERARFGGRLSSSFEIDPSCAEALVPGLVLQPLVENAVQHAIAPRAAGGAVAVRARVRAGMLQIDVADDGSPDRPHERFFEEGHGLANVRDRIANLYSGAGAITIAARAGGGTVVTLRLPARTGARTPAAGSISGAAPTSGSPAAGSPSGAAPTSGSPAAAFSTGGSATINLSAGGSPAAGSPRSAPERRGPARD